MVAAENIVNQLIGPIGFPCVGAKTAASKGQIKIIEGHSLLCPADDMRIFKAVGEFVKDYEMKPELFSSLIVLFSEPTNLSEEQFESAFWQRLQSLHDIDSLFHKWDNTVSCDPNDSTFSFSLWGKAFYLVGMHPHSSRLARRMEKPAIVFNLHEQFERLRSDRSYKQMQSVIRRRDRVYSGDVNPMLVDFGQRSEAMQYSGRHVDEHWTCPFSVRH